MRSQDLVIGNWSARFLGRTLPCAIGRGGIGEKEGEGDGITPCGVWKVEEWLYRGDRLHFEGTVIGFNQAWSDDANMDDYNQRVQLPYQGSHERLARADGLYNLIGVLDYNRQPIVSGRGSAIFLHIWRRPRFPTEGCVAFAPEDLLFIARNWRHSSRVIIQ